MDTTATVDRFFTDNFQGLFIPTPPAPRIKKDPDDSQSNDREVALLGTPQTLKGNIQDNIFITQTPRSPHIKNLHLKIDSIRLRQKWVNEGIKPPTIECKKLAKSLVARLYENFRIIPERISTTVEEGIFVKYVNYENSQELSIEIDNDLDMIALITKKDNAITCKEITFESLSEISKTFQEK